MNVFLNILKYGLVVVLAIVGLFIIACGCLVLFPGANIFGLSYVSFDNEPVLTQYYLYEDPYASSNKIQVDAGMFNVNVKIVNEDKITNGSTHLSVQLNRNLTGFVIGDDADKKIELVGNQVTDGEDKVLSLKITQPQKGWLFPTSCEVSLLVPKNALNEKELVINTTSGSIVIGNDPVYNESKENTTTFIDIKSLNATTQKGDVTLGCVNFSQPLNITQESGTITSKIDLGVDAILSQTKGFGNIKLKNVGTETNPKNLVIKSIWNSAVNIGTIYGDVVAGDIKGGSIKIDTISGDGQITNDYADVTIKSIHKNLIYTANEGALNITEVLGKINVTQKSGSVKIINLGNNGSAYLQEITTINAGVEVSKLHNDVLVKAEKGEVKISGCPDDTTPAQITVNAKDSKINLYKVNGSVDYTCDEGNSAIYVEYDKLVGLNNFKNQIGAVDILMPLESTIPMWLNWQTNNQANIKLYSFESAKKLSSEVDGATENGVAVNGATASTAEKLNIITKLGKISLIRKSA